MDPTYQTQSGWSKKRRFVVVLAGLGLLAAAIVGVTTIITPDTNTKKTAPRDKPAPVTATVQITPTGFEPATLTVKRGTRIIWTNTDQKPHQIAANSYPTGDSLRNLKSEILNNAQSYTYVASTAGNFGYHDRLNPTINGTLTVQKQ